LDNSNTFLNACTIGSVTAFAKPHKANKEVSSMKGMIISLETIGAEFDFFIL
jgi:hypothetical protein